MINKCRRISQKEIKEFNRRFYIDKKWKLRYKINHYKKCKGDEAGFTHKSGYRNVIVNLISYKVHRVIWCMYYGKSPLKNLDHKDKDKINNNPKNLWEVTQQQNNINFSKRKDNKSGITGVDWVKRQNKWRAQIQYKKKKYNLGVFKNKKDAIKARKAAEKKYGFTND